jgi:hypothetical protein
MIGARHQRARFWLQESKTGDSSYQNANRERTMPSEMSSIALFISILGFLVSATTLFLTQFRPPHIGTIVGPAIKLYYPSDGGFGIYVPVTFVNTSQKTGGVLRCGITMYSKAAPDTKYYMECRYFMKLESTTSSTQKFLYDDYAHGIAIPQNSFVSKIIWTTWSHLNERSFQITEGDHVMVFHYWSGPTGTPLKSEHSFYVSNVVYKQLEEYRIGKDDTIVDVDLDQPLTGDAIRTVYSNMLLNAEAAKSLLGI